MHIVLLNIHPNKMIMSSIIRKYFLQNMLPDHCRLLINIFNIAHLLLIGISIRIVIATQLALKTL